MQLIIVVAMVIFLLSNIAEAETYKWVDKNGVIHFSYTPPEREQAEIIMQKHDNLPSDDQSIGNNRVNKPLITEQTSTVEKSNTENNKQNNPVLTEEQKSEQTKENDNTEAIEKENADRDSRRTIIKGKNDRAAWKRKQNE